MIDEDYHYVLIDLKKKIVFFYPEKPKNASIVPGLTKLTKKDTIRTLFAADPWRVRIANQGT
jgi:hypothetical protein